MEILTIETASLGDRSYIVTDGDVAAVIDPQRDIDRVVALLEQRGLHVTDVFETHVHNDYVTGGFQLARTYGATYHVAAADEVAFERNPIQDGDVVTVGQLRIEALHTPGHTPTHMSYALHHDGEVVAVFTGGSLLFGSVGRTDLISPAMTEELARAQYASAHRLGALPDTAEVRPTHGFGSFCSSGSTTGAAESTIGTEKQVNDAFAAADEDAFVRDLIAGLDAWPAYYVHMAPRNRQGPTDVDLSPPAPVDTTELLRRIHAGEWVVDLRDRIAFAKDHVTGTINIELSDSASTYLGWTVPWDMPITLLGDTPEAVAAMQRQMVRIGIDRPAGSHVGDPDASAPRDQYEVTDFAGVAAAREAGLDPWVLDTRLANEFAARHIEGATHIPLHELLTRIDEIPTDRMVWVHCAGGYRASIAASLLARAGRQVTLVDGSFDEQAPVHLPMAA